MYFIKVISYMVVILCTSNYITCQNYEDDVYDDYSSEGEAKSDSAETSGFVTPLDFSPLFGGGFGGISGVASAPVKKIQSIFNLGGGETAVGHDFFQGQSSDKQFSPETFGFLPQFSQGLVAETVSVPKRYQEKVVQIERTKATATSSDITRSPLQFNIETKHVPFKKIVKPELNAALKLADYKSGVINAPKKIDDGLLLKEEHLAPYKKYSFQPGDNLDPTPTYASLSGGYPGTNAFSQNFDDHNLRYKRYSNKRKPKARKARQDEESEGDDSGYNYRSDYSSRPKDFDDSDAYDAPDFSGYDGEKGDKKNYEYGEDEEYGSDEYERIKSLSQKQAAELKKHPENCKQVQKNSMTCTVCTNPKNGGSYESCAYASEPKNNKYAYVKQQKFDSNDEPENQGESKEAAKTEQPVKAQRIKASTPKNSSVKPTKQAYQTHSSYKYSSPKVYTTSKPVKSSNSQRYTKANEKPSSDYRDYYTAPVVIKGESSKPEKYSAYPQEEEEEEDEEEEGDEQPESNEEANEDESEEDSPIPGFFTNNEEKKDVESVLAEFTKKDRSACKKVLKNHMTCYQCTDKNGMNHEECMFVSESAPKTSHLAYKEVKEFNSKPQAAQNANGNDGAESQIVTVKPLAELILSTTESSLDLFTKIKKNQPLKKYNGLEDFKKITPTTFIASPLDKITTQFQIASTASTKLDLSPTKLIIKREARKKNKEHDEYEKFDAPPSDLSTLDRIADPEDFAGAESKGAFWAETVPQFNEKLGVALPRYMLEKTEDEAEFEKALAANSK